jgi:hypothetical protein
MKNNSKDKSIKKSVDKMLLFLSAIVVSICLFVFLYFFSSTKISEEWEIFVLMSILYVFVFIYGINMQIGLKKKVTNLISILLLIFFAVFPIIVGFTIFYFKFLPFPKRNFTYLIIGLLLLPTSILCFHRSLKFFERRKRSKVGH